MVSMSAALFLQANTVTVINNSLIRDVRDRGSLWSPVGCGTINRHIF